MVRLEEGEPLTPREREVLLLTMQGLSCRQIGARLGRSVKTVESHRYHIYVKSGAGNLAALARWAIRQGLIEA